MGFFFLRKKHLQSSAESCRAKSTWKESLLFFSMTFNCKIIASLLYFCVCMQWKCDVRRKLVQNWREGPKLQLGSCKLMWADLGAVYFTVFPKKLPSLLKSCHLLLSAELDIEASYALYRIVSLTTCCWLGELVLLQCHPYVNSTLRKAAAAQLGQCWGPSAVIKVKLKASKEGYPCTSGVPSGLCGDLFLVSNPSWACISSPRFLGNSFLIFFILCFLASGTGMLPG